MTILRERQLGKISRAGSSVTPKRRATHSAQAARPSSSPATVGYWLIAGTAARKAATICGSVGSSESPTEKSKTSRPAPSSARFSACSASAG